MPYLASGDIRNVFPPRHLHTTGQGGIENRKVTLLADGCRCDNLPPTD